MLRPGRVHALTSPSDAAGRTVSCGRACHRGGRPQVIGGCGSGGRGPLARSGARQPGEVGLRRTPGLGDAIVVGLGAMLGAGIFAALAPAARAAGSGLLLGLAAAAVVAHCNPTSSARLAAQPRAAPVCAGGIGCITLAFALPAVSVGVARGCWCWAWWRTEDGGGVPRGSHQASERTDRQVTGAPGRNGTPRQWRSHRRGCGSTRSWQPRGALAYREVRPWSRVRAVVGLLVPARAGEPRLEPLREGG